MNKHIALLSLLLSCLTCHWSNAQTKISGTITSAAGEAQVGANVYLLHTLSGASADINGHFSFTSDESGEKTIVVSAIGYQKQEQVIQLSGVPIVIDFQLREEASQLNEVLITAGSIEASSDREVAVLKPMDIYTNAAAAGDIVGAIQTLPGTQRVAEQTGLFVRGGDASESTVIIDGMVVQNAFFSTVPGVAQRSRFTPFQFKGMAFSSGGYGVRYGQALSSILELNTLDVPDQSTLSANINMSGVALSGIKKWKQSAIELTGYYNNLSPFYKIAQTNFNFYDVPSGGGGSAKWSAKNSKGGIIKAFFKHDYYESGTEIPNPYDPQQTIRFGLKNQNTYVNTSFRQLFNKTLFYTAFSGSRNEDKTDWSDYPITGNDWRYQWRGEATSFIRESWNVTFGSELQRYQFRQNYDTAAFQFNEMQSAVYIESEWKPAKIVAIKPGVRSEYSSLLSKGNIAPRIAMAVKTGSYTQLSFASGIFYQLPDKRYLLRDYQLDFQKAVHYMANYQWIKDDRSFRIEGYYKSYLHLSRELTATYNPNPYRFVSGPVDNSGDGYAQGVDLFWRDQHSLKNFDYWIAYSFVDTKRLYANLKEKATPEFVSNHNFNLTTKYLIEAIQMNVGVTYSYASGRPYYDPTNINFLGNHSPDYHNLAFNLSYLTSLGKWFTVFYASVDNVLNHKNILGYRYSPDGLYRSAVLPPLYRTVFIGANISLSAFKKDEL